MHSDTDLPVTPGLHTWRGSCTCGAVRWEADVDLYAGTHQCNCTRCTKTGWWSVILRPAAFRLLSGEEHLAPVGSGTYFPRRRCGICGVESFSEGHLPQIGGDFVGISVRCLDGVDLRGVPVRYLDGLHDSWMPLFEAPWQNPFRPVGA